MDEPIRIALIDDDEAVLDSLLLYLTGKGIDVTCHDSASSFVAALDDADAPGRLDCIVADVRMPGLSGLDLVAKLVAAGSAVPVILITGHGDVAMAVSAIKVGAFDFIEKPFDEEKLLDVVRRAAEIGRKRQDEAAALAELRQRFDGLSARQRQVMERAAAGLSNKEIARALDISVKTVENHRAWVMERMGARNLAELVRMATRLGVA